MGASGSGSGSLSSLENGKIIIGDSLNLPVEVKPSGVILIDNLGVTSFAKFQYVTKTVDETIISDSTFSNDSDLFFNVEINSEYEILLKLYITSGAVPDFKSIFSSLIGATGNRLSTTVSGGAPSTVSDFFTGQIYANGGIKQQVIIFCILTTTTNAGTIYLQWAQNTLDATNTTVHKNSSLIVRKLN